MEWEVSTYQLPKWPMGPQVTIPMNFALLKRALCCCLLVLSSEMALADPPQEAGSISLAFYELGVLYYKTADGGHAGIDQDVVEELSRRTGLRFQPVLESRVRIWTRLANGTLDMSVSGISTPEREQFARFIPYFATRNYILMRRDLPASAQSPEGFLADPSYKIAVVKSFKHGVEYDRWLALLRARGRVREVADFQMVLHLLKIGRVQAVLALPTSWVPALKQQGMAATVQVLDWWPKDTIVHGLVLSRQRVPEAAVQRMATAIQSMRDDGTLSAIFQRHMGPEMASSLLRY